jgi:hypothetical protein
MKAWHFVGSMLRDGRSIPADGVTLRHDGWLTLCVGGLHASLQPFDALQYAPGSTLCLVDCGGQIVSGNDKLVCSERTIIVRMDAGPLLRWFARQQALSVVHLWDAPDVVLDYLMGEDDAWAAAREAAWDAALAAARPAAWDAARASTRPAVWDAARAAAWAAARPDARAEFNDLVRAAFADYLED